MKLVVVFQIYNTITDTYKGNLPATRLLSYPLANFHQHNLVISDSYLKKKGHQKLISIYTSQEELSFIPTCRMKRGSDMSRYQDENLMNLPGS